MARFEEGHPIGYFWGYKTEGVMQNDADVKAYLDKNCGGKAENSKQGTGIKPGDLKFVDVNGDGVVNDDDKQRLVLHSLMLPWVLLSAHLTRASTSL